MNYVGYNTFKHIKPSRNNNRVLGKSRRRFKSRQYRLVLNLIWLLVAMVCWFHAYTECLARLLYAKATTHGIIACFQNYLTQS